MFSNPYIETRLKWQGLEFGYVKEGTSSLKCTISQYSDCIVK